MNAAQLHVEQVLIGAVVLSAAMLPWLPELSRWVEYHQGALNLIAGTVSLGAAYLVGIIFDRLADTLTEPLEAHQRLRMGLERVAKKARDGKPGSAWTDPFPEHTYRLHALRETEPVVSWVNYHRSRVRLSRAMALYLPVTTWCGVIGLARLWHLGTLEPWHAWIAWSAILLAWAATVVRLRTWMPKAWRKIHNAPRTDEKWGVLVYAITRGYCRRKNGDKKGRRWILTMTFASSPVVLAIGLILAGSLLVAADIGGASDDEPSLMAMAFTGAVLSALAGVTWWRISITYRAYLRLIYETSGDSGVDTIVV